MAQRPRPRRARGDPPDPHRRGQPLTSHPATPKRLPHVLPFEQVVDPARTDRAAGVPRGARAGRRRRRLVGDVPGGDAGLPRPRPTAPTSRPGWSRSRTARRSTYDGPQQRRAVPTDERARPRPARRRPDRARAAVRRPEASCPTSNGRPSPTTTSAGCSHREVAEVLGGTDAAARRASADGIENLRDRPATEEEHP